MVGRAAAAAAAAADAPAPAPRGGACGCDMRPAEGVLGFGVFALVVGGAGRGAVVVRVGVGAVGGGGVVRVGLAEWVGGGAVDDAGRRVGAVDPTHGEYRIEKGDDTLSSRR